MELIGIREASRRLGVSDTAVHKAIKAGRIRLAEPTPSGRPRVAWPGVQEEWHGNTDVSKRSHAGPKTNPPAPPAPPVQEAPTQPAPTAPAAAPAPDHPPIRSQPMGPSYAQSRAIREAYQAKLAKLEYEERIGKLIDADQLRIEAFKIHRRVRDAILNIPDRCSPQLASMSDQAEVHAYLNQEITAALRQLSADIYSPQGQ